nr:MAG TPA: hypothetical protein [Bacteriophage sp.]
MGFYLHCFLNFGIFFLMKQLLYPKLWLELLYQSQNSKHY